jgi:hypothetical protein
MSLPRWQTSGINPQETCRALHSIVYWAPIRCNNFDSHFVSKLQTSIEVGYATSSDRGHF